MTYLRERLMRDQGWDPDEETKPYEMPECVKEYFETHSEAEWAKKMREEAAREKRGYYIFVVIIYVLIAIFIFTL